MGVVNRETREIHAKIVYCGPAGAGTTANLEFIHRKLKFEHRGDLKVQYARGEDGPYEFLPVQLGAVRGYTTSIHVHTVPAGDDFVENRRAILDGVDGIVFVADVRPKRQEATVEALRELQSHLDSYNRSFDEVVLIVQYNHKDGGDENSLDSLHRRLGLKPAECFDAIASEGTGVLQCLTTLSKLILSKIRSEAEAGESGFGLKSAEPAEPVGTLHVRSDPPTSASLPTPAAAREVPPPAPVAPPVAPVVAPAVPVVPATAPRSTVDVAQVQAKGFQLQAAGPVETEGSELHIPLQLVDEASGREVELTLRLSIAPQT